MEVDRVDEGPAVAEAHKTDDVAKRAPAVNGGTRGKRLVTPSPRGNWSPSDGVQLSVPFHLAMLLAIVLVLQAQVEILPPSFTARQIGPTGGWLWPGRMFSIYGTNLGPVDSCVRDAGPFRPEGPNPPEQLAVVERTLPMNLCGVVVLLDERPVPLIYVSEKQINFVVPGSRSFGNKVIMRVVRVGVRSIPVTVKFGPDPMWLYQDDKPAYTGMPVWVRLYRMSEAKVPVELPFGIPFISGPNCPRIEVKFNGDVLSPRQRKTPLTRVRYSGPPCPAPAVPDRQLLAGRIPLHLLYRFDRPGTYFARYVPGSNVFGLPATTAETDWTPIEVKAGNPAQRRKWLREKRLSPPTDREELVYDFLPSIFGYGDPEALQIGLAYVYNPDMTVSGWAGVYLRDYHAASEFIPLLKKLKGERGSNEVVDRLLTDLGESGARR